MKRFFLFLFCVLAVFFVFFYYLLNTPFFLSSIIPRFVKENYPAFNLQSLRIRNQTFSFPDILTLSNVQFSVEHKGMAYECEFSQIAFHDILNLKTANPQFNVYAKGGNIRWDNAHFKEAWFKVLFSWQENFQESIDGVLGGGETQVGRYRFDKFSARARKDEERFQIFEISANGYGGKARGQISTEDISLRNYVVWLEFFDLEPKELQELNEGFFSQLSGSLDGTIRIVGGVDGLDLFAGRLSFSKAGVIKPALLEKIIGKVSDEQQKERLQLVRQADKQLFVEQGYLHLDKSRNRQLILSFNLQNKTLNVNLREIVNLGVDIKPEQFLLEIK